MDIAKGPDITVPYKGIIIIGTYSTKTNVSPITDHAVYSLFYRTIEQKRRRKEENPYVMTFHVDNREPGIAVAGAVS